MDLQAKTTVSIQARVHRIAWDRRPAFVPKALWLWLGKKRFPGVGRWENLGTIASSERNTASVERLAQA